MVGEACTRVLVSAAFAACVSCSTARQVRILEVQRLEAQRTALVQTREILTNGGLPLRGEDVEIFIGSSFVNQALSAAVGKTFAIPDGRDILFTVDELQTSFGNGIPAIRLVLSAQHSRWGYRVRLRALAYLEVNLQGEPPTSGNLEVRVARVVPEAHWFFLRLRFWSFVRSLSHIRAQGVTDALPQLTLPFHLGLPFTTAFDHDMAIHLGNSTVKARTVSKGVSLAGDLAISRVLFLEDGIRMYLKLAS